jgi:pimeloyl-ACP methyl ester carboxylesterase
VAVGDNDTMMHTKNSQLLAERVLNAHLRIYPDANHGFLDQYPELFADHVRSVSKCTMKAGDLAAGCHHETR